MSVVCVCEVCLRCVCFVSFENIKDNYSYSFLFFSNYMFLDRTHTLQRQLRMSTITNQGHPLWSQGTGIMTLPVGAIITYVFCKLVIHELHTVI